MHIKLCKSCQTYDVNLTSRFLLFCNYGTGNRNIRAATCRIELEMTQVVICGVRVAVRLPVHRGAVKIILQNQRKSRKRKLKEL